MGELLTKGANLFIKCLFLEVYQFYLSPKIPKYSPAQMYCNISLNFNIIKLKCIKRCCSILLNLCMYISPSQV